MNAEMDIKLQLLAGQLGQDEATELVMLVLATARRIDEACAQLLSEYGLSEGRFAVLLALRDIRETSPAVLAERLGVTRATMTGLLDGLAKSRLVSRKPDPTDRRAQVVTMTTRGTKLVEKLIPLYRQWLRQVAKNVDSQQPLVVVLTQLQENLGVLPQAGQQ